MMRDVLLSIFVFSFWVSVAVLFWIVVYTVGRFFFQLLKILFGFNRAMSSAKRWRTDFDNRTVTQDNLSNINSDPIPVRTMRDIAEEENERLNEPLKHYCPLTEDIIIVMPDAEIISRCGQNATVLSGAVAQGNTALAESCKREHLALLAELERRSNLFKR
jgi:hypothetical protein